MSAKDRDQLYHYAAGVGGSEPKQYSPGGDMTQGVARAHIETPDEIDANPIDDAPVQTCEACLGTATDLDFECPATETGVHVMNFELTEDEAEALAEPEMNAATAEQVLGISLSTAYRFQHAKVLRFEISVGANDDERTIEEFEEDVRAALALMNSDTARRGGFHNLTTLGGYYIIDGKVCQPADYDPATKGRKPGTVPPPWAGGPAKGKETEYLAEERTSTPAAPTKATATRTAPTKVASGANKVETVAALAAGINKQVKGKS